MNGVRRPFQKALRRGRRFVCVSRSWDFDTEARFICQVEVIWRSAAAEKGVSVSSLVLFQAVYKRDEFLMSFFSKLR